MAKAKEIPKPIELSHLCSFTMVLFNLILRTRSQKNATNKQNNNPGLYGLANSECNIGKYVTVSKAAAMSPAFFEM